MQKKKTYFVNARVGISGESWRVKNSLDVCLIIYNTDVWKIYRAAFSKAVKENANRVGEVCFGLWIQLIVNLVHPN